MKAMQANLSNKSIGIVLELFLGAVILTGDLSDFRTVMSANFGYFVTTRMAATRIGFSRPAGFDLGLRNSGVHISGPEFEISRPEFRFAP